MNRRRNHLARPACLVAMRFRLAGSRLTAAWTATTGTAAPAAAAPRTHSGGLPARKSTASARMMTRPGTMRSRRRQRRRLPPAAASRHRKSPAGWEALPCIRFAAARPSSNSRQADSHRRLSTHRVRSSTMCAGGPPNPITPIRAHWAAIASGTRSPGVSAAGSWAGTAPLPARPLGACDQPLLVPGFPSRTSPIGGAQACRGIRQNG